MGLCVTEEQMFPYWFLLMLLDQLLCRPFLFVGVNYVPCRCQSVGIFQAPVISSPNAVFCYDLNQGRVRNVGKNKGR